MSVSDSDRFRFSLPMGWLARLWIVVIIVLLCAEWLYPGFDLNLLTTLYFWITLAVSIVCFVAYGVDKRRANRQARRISERTLHLLALLGGWPGAVIGQKLFHHKTQKIKFRAVLAVIILIHVCLSGYFLYQSIRDKQRREELLEQADTAHNIGVSVVRSTAGFPGENVTRFRKDV